MATKFDKCHAVALAQRGRNHFYSSQPPRHSAMNENGLVRSCLLTGRGREGILMTEPSTIHFTRKAQATRELAYKSLSCSRRLALKSLSNRPPGISASRPISCLLSWSESVSYSDGIFNAWARNEAKNSGYEILPSLFRSEL
jgi:hypothetical protein